MSSPYTSEFQVFADGTDATATAALPGDGHWAGSADLSFTGTGFTGTFNFQGRPHEDAEWQNIPYAVLDESPAASVAAVSLTTSSDTIVYTILRPMPYMQAVMTRSAGSFKMLGRYTGNTAALPLEAGTSPTTAATSDGYGATTTVTRPANTTPYTANDVVGGAIDLGVMGPSAGDILITSAALEIDVAAVPAGMTTFRLALYNVTPPSAVADNGAFDIPSGDRTAFLGFIDIGTPVDEVSTLFVQANNVNKHVTLAGTNLFAYLVTAGGFTPAGNSEVYKVTLKAVAV